MNFFLKILNESKSRALLRVTGYSGVLYPFKWNGSLRCYTYQPKSQAEVDDLYKTMRRTTGYIFCPCSQPAQAAPDLKAQVEDLTARLEKAGQELADAKKPATPLDDMMTEQCLQRGIVVSEDDSNDTAKRLVDAYDKGATDALASVPSNKKRGGRQAPPE